MSTTKKARKYPDVEQAKQVLALCKENGVKYFQLGDLAVEFFASEPQIKEEFDPKKLSAALAEQMPPDSAMMFMSSEGIDEEQTSSS